MRKSRFSESQIVSILSEYNANVPVSELARRHAVHSTTIRRWQTKYGGLSVSDVARTRQLEGENSRLKRIAATQAIYIDALKFALSKKYESTRSARRR
jgi:putative transposase